MCWRETLTYIQSSSSRLPCQFSLFVRCRGGGRDERQVAVPLFGLDAVATDRSPASILPSISIDVDVYTLLLSFVLCLSFFALLSHHMVTCPSLRPPDRLLIPISPSLNSPSPQNQRSVRISSLSSVLSPVHRTSFPPTPILLPRGLGQSLTPSLILLQRQRCEEIP